jgi:hypothetical protein
VRATAEQKEIARLAARVAELEYMLAHACVGCGKPSAPSRVEPQRDADPCPVDAETLERWSKPTGNWGTAGPVIVWLTRQVMAMRERGV